MRAVSLHLVLFSLYLSAQAANLCPPVDCSASLRSSMCYSFDESAYAIRLHSCNANEVCEVNEMASSYDYDLTNKGLYCKGSSYLPEAKYPGETCKVKQECRSGVCGDGICQGMPVGAACKGTADCESGVVCQSGICEFQQKAGSSCQEDENCANNLLCHQGVCTSYFSLSAGQSGVENPYLCKSGYEELGVCQQAPKNANAPDSTCSKDSECPLTNKKDGVCQCGMTTDGVAFCAAQPGDEEFLTYQNYLKQVLDTSVDCHYNISFSRRCTKQATNPTFSSYLNSFYIYRYRAQIISIPNCVFTIMPFALDYSYSGASLGSSSGTNTTIVIAVSVCVVAGLILAGVVCFLCVRRIAMREARELRVHNGLVAGEYESVDIKEGIVSIRTAGDQWESQFTPEDLKLTVRDLIYLLKGIPVARSLARDTQETNDGLEAELPLARPKSNKEETVVETASDTKRSTALFAKRSP